jgi:hypothetical protein
MLFRSLLLDAVIANVVLNNPIAVPDGFKGRRVFLVLLQKHSVGGKPVIETEIFEPLCKVILDTAKEHRYAQLFHVAQEMLQALHEDHIGIAGALDAQNQHTDAKAKVVSQFIKVPVHVRSGAEKQLALDIVDEKRGAFRIGGS